MIYLVYHHKSGRSGHALKNIMTIFALKTLIDNSVVIYHSSYAKQHILNGNDIKSECVDEQNIKFDKTITVNNYVKWGGITFNDFTKLKNNINDLSKKYENIKVVIEKVYRIHPFILHNWFIEKKITENLYQTQFLPLLGRIYYRNKDSKTKNQISIHVRRGDVAQSQIKRGFNNIYYQNIVNTFNKEFNLPINIYTEDYNNKDLLSLKNINNVTLYFGGVSDIDNHFHNLCVSKILVLSSSSFSTWAAYLSKGNVLFHENEIKHFNHKVLPDNFYSYVPKTFSNKVQIIKDKIKINNSLIEKEKILSIV